MDFIERIFGIALDGGSGALEAVLFLIPLVGLLAVWQRQRKREPGTAAPLGRQAGRF